MRSLTFLLVTLAAGVPTTSAGQHEVNDNYFGMLEWRNVGPNRGGRSIAVSGSESHPHEYYFGATGGGLWKSNDAGLNWRPVTDGQIGSASVGAVAVAPSDPDIVYIGMGEGQLRANVLQGDGIYRSDDGGETWRHLGLDKTLTITTIRVHPDDPELVYAAALGDPFRASEERGVFRSRDGGKNWEKVLYRSPEAGAIDLAMDANDPDVMYATVWQVYRKPWKLWSGGPQSGIFKSTDGGDSWSEITHHPGLPTTVIGKMTVAVSPADSNRIYANIEAENGGLYRSDDGGATWQWVNGDRKLWQRAFYFLQVRADPSDRDTVYVLSFQLERSIDAGETFSAVKTRHVDIHDLWIDPNDSSRMIVADDGGASVTINNGRSWTEQDFPTAQIYRVTTTDDFPYHICGAQQDSTTECVVSRRESAIANLDHRFTDSTSRRYTIGPGESGYVGVHPGEPGVFFSGGTNALRRFDRATGRLSDVQPFPFVVMGQTAKSMQERWNWTYPIVFDRSEPHALYVGSQHVWRSTDLGENWENISPDLTRADPETLGETGGPVMLDQDGPEVYATLFSLAVSPVNGQELWAGSDDGLVHVTRDGGGAWVDVTPPDLRPNSKITSIDVSVRGGGQAYVAAKRHEMGDRAPYAWKTADWGETWTRIDRGIESDEFIHVLRSDPHRPGLLYAGTEQGVLVSFDDGATWQSLSLNLPTIPVFDLLVRDNDLVIATFGRSFYVLEGLATLRQVTAVDPDGALILYAPARAYRPIVPAAIDFYFADTANHVSLVIKNLDGTVLRHLLRDEMLPAGPHRVTWNLRHDGAQTFPGMILESPSPAIGPLVVPGRYLVELEEGGRTVVETIEVLADPRVDLEPGDYEEQLAFALQVRDATSLANRTVIEVRGLRAAIDAYSASDFAVDERLAAIRDEIAAVEAELYQVRNASPKDKIAYPIKLNDRLAGLLSFHTLGSGRPTTAQREVFDVLFAHLTELRLRFQRAEASWLEESQSTATD